MDRNKIANLSDLRTEVLEELDTELREEFAEKRTEELTVEGVTERVELGEAIKAVAEELADRKAAEEATPAPSEEDLAAAAAAADALVDEATPAEAAPAEAELAVEEAAPVETAPEAPAAEDIVPEALAPEAVAAAADITPASVETDLEVAAGPLTAPASITAGGDIPSVTAGSPLADMKAVSNAFVARRSAFRGLSKEGDGEQVVVASIRADYPEERKLHSGELERNMEKIEDAAGSDALVASGGLCAPLEPYYGIQVISQAARPVRDALPKFGADRGGVRFLPPPVLSDVNDAIGVTTAAQDVGPYGDTEGDTPFKPCLHVVCGVEEEVTVSAIHRCLTFGNFAARTYPEQVEAWLALAIAAHARRAETLILDAIDAASIQTTAAASYSAVRSLLPQIDQAVAAYRSRNRTAVGLKLRILLPEWSKSLIRADLARSFQGNDLDPLGVSDAQIGAWFTARDVVPSFYLDTATGAGQVFGAQGAGVLTAFPSTVVWYLFVEGSFVFLDGGTLDLGLVRDSTLNRTNDYQIFAETFEAVAFFGIESVKVTSTVCPNGVRSPEATGGPKPCA
jgi:hypothetical protein